MPMQTQKPLLAAQGAHATVNQMIELLRRLGNLSAYILEITSDDLIILQSFRSNPVCTTLPPPTTLGDAVESVRLNKALLTVELLNQAIDNGDDTPYGEPRTACLKPGTWQVDEAMTACVQHLPKAFAEPELAGGTLPRLGPEQVKLDIGDLRRLLADLSSYLDAIVQDEQGPVVRIFDDATGNAAEPIDPTPLSARIDKARFGLAQAAMQLINIGLRGDGFRWEPVSRGVGKA
jgi:hypothetical protein